MPLENGPSAELGALTWVTHAFNGRSTQGHWGITARGEVGIRLSWGGHQTSSIHLGCGYLLCGVGTLYEFISRHLRFTP